MHADKLTKLPHQRDPRVAAETLLEFGVVDGGVEEEKLTVATPRMGVVRLQEVCARLIAPETIQMVRLDIEKMCEKLV